MTPLVSVCIPTYNGERYVRECIESVISQTFGDLEIVVVDDASQDETTSIVREYAACDRRIRLVTNTTNVGLVPNWNRCIDLSKGTWIKFVLQDDFIKPDCIAKMMEVSSMASPFRVCKRHFLFERVEAEVEKLYSSYNVTWSMEKIFPGLTRISPERFCESVRKCGTMNFIGEPTAVLIHRDVFKRFGCFNPNFVQLCDLECWLRIGIRTGIYYIPEVLATFRVHSASATATGRSNAFFRTNVIDPLLLLHEFARNPLFRPLRKGRFGYHTLKFHQQLAEASYNARTTVCRWTSESSASYSASILEWNKIVEQYPLLDHSLYSYLIEAREALAKYFWRFHRAD